MQTGLLANILTDKCKKGKGKEQCRYLAFSENSKTWQCCKLLPVKDIIDRELKSLLTKIDDPFRIPNGDNCDGVK